MTTVMMHDGQTMAPAGTVSMSREARSPDSPDQRVTPADPLLLVRQCLPSDADRLRELFGRCSPSTRYQRFHAGLREIPAAYLRQVLAGDLDVHDALVVEVRRPDPRGGSLVAIGSAARVPSDRGATVEVAVLVEDGWQRRGIGTSLLLGLVARAGRRGVENVRWCMLTQGKDLVPTLRREFGPLAVRRVGAVITAEARFDRQPTTPGKTPGETPGETPWQRP